MVDFEEEIKKFELRIKALQDALDQKKGMAYRIAELREKIREEHEKYEKLKAEYKERWGLEDGKIRELKAKIEELERAIAY